MKFIEYSRRLRNVIYDKADAAEALEGTLWAINMVKRAIK